MSVPSKCVIHPRSVLAAVVFPPPGPLFLRPSEDQAITSCIASFLLPLSYTLGMTEIVLTGMSSAVSLSTDM